MRFAKDFLGVLLLSSASAAVSQESLCNPCVDKPAPVASAATIRKVAAPPSASDIFSRTQELGGELRDVAHDCGVSRTTSLGQVDFTARACSWGGRHPALLLEPDDEGSLVLLASNGSTVEVLFAEAPSAAFVGIFSGLVKEDFDKLFLEISEPSER